MNTSSIVLEHDGATFDFGSLPEASQKALARAGLVHYRGNRVASGVVGHFKALARKAWISANSDEAWKALDKTAQTKIEKDGLPDTETEAYTSKYSELRTEIDESIRAGTLGEGREASVKLSPLEVEMLAIAKRETIEILTKKELFVATGKRRVPKADDEFNIGNEVLSFEELVSRRQTRFSDRMEKEAKRILSDREKSVAKVAGEDLAEAF